MLRASSTDVTSTDSVQSQAKSMQRSGIFSSASPTLSQRAYTQLTKATIPAYLRTLQVSALQSFAEAEHLTIDEIGDGNLNYVFRVINPAGDSIIIKQAPPYLRCVGESYPLSVERMRFEIRYAEIAAWLMPKHIPRLLHTDSDVNMLMIMQDLKQHKILRKGFIAGEQHPYFSDHIAVFMATMLFKTSRLHMERSEHEKLIKKFAANELCKITDDYFFTFAFERDQGNHRQESFSYLFRKNALELRTLFATTKEALIHGDLHTGSLMGNATETYVIDGEFAIMGPMSFDLGLLLANLMTAYVSHASQDHADDYQKILLVMMRDIVTRFNQHFIASWNEKDVYIDSRYFTLQEKQAYQQEYLQRILSQAIGFAGVEMCRRSCGLAGVAEIRDIQNTDAKERAEQMAIQLGKTWVEHYAEFSNIENVIAKITALKSELLTSPMVTPLNMKYN